MYNVELYEPQENRKKAGSLTALIILSCLFKYKYLIVFSTLVITAVGVAIVHSLPYEYSSEAQILVKSGRDSLSGDESIDIPESSLGSMFNEVTNVVTMMRGRALAELVVDELGAETINQKPPNRPVVQWIHDNLDAWIPQKSESTERNTDDGFRKAAIDRIRGNLSLRERGNIIHITYEAQDPHLAQTINETIINKYRDKHIAATRPSMSADFYRQSTTDAKKDFEAKTEALTKFRKDVDIVSVASSLPLHDEARVDLESQMQDIQSQIVASEARVAEYERGLAALTQPVAKAGDSNETPSAAPAPFIENDLIRELKRQLIGLETEAASLARKYYEGDPILEEAQFKIDYIKKAIAREEEQLSQATPGSATVAAPLAGTPQGLEYQELRMQLIRERAQLIGLQANASVKSMARTDIQEKINKLKSLETQERKLISDVNLAEESYNSTRRNEERFRIQMKIKDEMLINVSTVDPPSLVMTPTGPNRKRGYILALAAGLMFAFALPLTLEYLRNTYRRTDEVVTDLGLPVLAVVTAKEQRSCI